MSSKKVVLVIPPQAEMTKEYLPSIGVAYLAAVLEKNGYGVKIIDSFAMGFNGGQTVDSILKESPFLVGVSANTHNRFNAIEIFKQVKERSNNEIFTVAGGPHFSLIPEQALANIPSLGAVVRGEGEETLLQLANHLVKYSRINPGELMNVPGLTFRGDDGIISTPNRDFIKNLDELPSPAWHLFNLDKYNARLEGTISYRAIGISSSRGCPQDCIFCVNSAFWKKFFRRHSPKRFVDEVEFLHKTYGYRAFDFWDDTLTVFKPHAMEICNEIINRGLTIKWYARARVNTVDLELLSLMKKSGCEVISFGVESGSEKILKVIQKNITLKQVRDAARFCKELDLITKFFFIHSLPQETEDDLNLSLDLMNELNSYSPKFHCYDSIARIYPGTQLETLAKNEGRFPIDFNWCKEGQVNIDEGIKNNSTFYIHDNIPLFENKDLPIKKIIEIVKQKRRDRIRKKSMFSLIKKGFKLILKSRNIKEVKSLAKKFIDLRIKK
jgi:anaerobic magnesium-protoporphyrin IX monomethyl ester cyclase